MVQDKYKILKEKGWIELESGSTDEELNNLAGYIGQIINHSNGENISKLNPKSSVDSIKGTLSSVYGYGNFPLHTDTAFWAIPARFILLHSIDKSSCNTHVLPATEIWNSLTREDKKNAERAIYLIKTTQQQFFSSLLFKINNIKGLKYDPMCMIPFNESAKQIQPKLQKVLFGLPHFEIEWTGNNTLIIDNWRILHGRGSAENDIYRELKRIYIN